MDRPHLFEYLRDARLAPHAAGERPVWLWSADGSEIIWANAAGAAVFGADSTAAIAGRRFASSQVAASQIARLNLKHDAPPQFARLRGFGAGFGRALLCACSRLQIAGRDAVLVAASEQAGPKLSFPERVARVVTGPGAVFAADGSPIHAGGDAGIADGLSLDALGASPLAAEAVHSGKASGKIGGRDGAIERIGKGESAFLLVTFEDAKPLQPDASVTGDQTGSAPVAQAMAETGIIDVSPLPERRTEQRIPEEIRPAFATAAHDGGDPVSEATAPAPGRRHPLRFVWQMDADGRFSLGSGEFAEVIGPGMAASFGRPWSEITAQLGIDPHGEVMRAVASRDTWSGITLGWPVEGSDDMLSVELSGLPVFDRDRTFRGYRGFGVCRDLKRIDALKANRLVSRGPGPQPAQPENASRNIVQLRAPAADTKPGNSPAPLTQHERSAFREIASRLSARLQSADRLASGRAGDQADAGPSAADLPVSLPASEESTAADVIHLAPEPQVHGDELAIVDRLPVGVLIYRHDQFHYANAAFLRWSGHRTLQEFSGSGGLDKLFIETHEQTADRNGGAGQSLRITNPAGSGTPVNARLFTVKYDGAAAMALVLAPAAEPSPKPEKDDEDIRAETETAELRAIIDIAADGAVIFNRSGRIVQANTGAEKLFGHTPGSLNGQVFFDLFAPDSARTARDCFDWLARDGAPVTLSEGRDVAGRLSKGGLVHLHMTMGRLGDVATRFCAVFRDISAWKKTQEDLLAAKRQAEKSSAAKSEFLAKISHEIRTPLNAIIGFSEVMMDERFGPVGNERYRAYLRDIHASGGHLISLLNDLLDLSKIEAGKLDLTFSPVNLNDVVQQSAAIMQAQAARERIIMRLALAGSLPDVVADARSVRQIALNLLSNAVKFTGAGGQVIVSTALSDRGDVTLRVRDNGAGMSEKDIATALEPFRQLSTSARYGSGGTGLGLPLTKALAEANHGTFSIRSGEESGTLIEIAFPATRVLAR